MQPGLQASFLTKHWQNTHFCEELQFQQISCLLMEKHLLMNMA